MAHPLMPKATAVWLVDNTTLTFDQIAALCELHPLEIQGIADGEVAIGIVGRDPVTNGELTREELPGAKRTRPNGSSYRNPIFRFSTGGRGRAIRRSRSGRTGRTPSLGWSSTIPS